MDCGHTVVEIRKRSGLSQDGLAELSGVAQPNIAAYAPDASLLHQVGLAQAIEDLLGVPVDVVSEAGLRPGREQIRAQARPL